MPALNFKHRFADKVAAGTKTHTVRAWRKRPFKAGDVLMFYTGMRTKACRKIRPDTVCLSAVAIEVDVLCGVVSLDPGSVNYPLKSGRTLSLTELTRLARADGFETVLGFFDFFADKHGGGCVRGQLVEWNPISLTL